MVKLSKYLIKDFLTTFGVAMLLVTFAFSVGAIYKAVDIMAKGFPVGVVGRFFVNNLPYSVAYTIPISALFSTLLLFGRLSTDSEVSAMKSGGLSLFQIASPIVLVAFLLMLFCFYNNFEVYPKTTYYNRQLIKSLGVEDPIKLLEEGRFIRDFPGFVVYVGGKSDNEVRDLIVYQLDRDTGRVNATIRAERGSLHADSQNHVLEVTLVNSQMEMADPDAPDDPTRMKYATGDEISPLRFDFDELVKKKKVYPKQKNTTFADLIYRVRNPEEGYGWLPKSDWAGERCRDLIEINQRICLSIAPFMFVLIAIPLGIRSHRKESSAGMMVSLAIVFLYYIFIILSDTFDKSPQLYPWLLPWIPILGGQIAALILLRRAE